MKNILLLSLAFVLVSFSAGRKPMFMPQPIGFVYVPTGTIILNGENYKSHAFWMSETEVTNREYREFLVTKKETGKYSPSKEVLENDLWISKYNNYFTDPLFDNFPVVGLTTEQMKAYAKWLSEKTCKENGIWLYEFRLPTKSEWQYAAAGGRSNSDFPWGGPYDRNSKGCMLLHSFDMSQRFAVYGEEAPNKYVLDVEIPDSLAKMEYDKILACTKNLKKTKRKHFGKSLPLVGLPVPGDSYFPNDYGLYGMSGNVAEKTHSGEVVGGSFKTSSEYCKITKATAYPFDAAKPQPDLGFRLVCSYQSITSVKDK